MIAHNLISLRKINKLTQEDVAEGLNVSRQAVAKWESGVTTPDISNCIALAKLYHVSIDDLVSHSEATNYFPIPPKGKHIFGVVTLGEKGQIVIPKRAREIFNLNAGDGLVLLGDEERGMALMKAEEMLGFYQQVKERLEEHEKEEEE